MTQYDALIMAACAAIALITLVTTIHLKFKNVVREIKDDYSVKTQLLQEELHVVYLRAVEDSKKRRSRHRRRIYAKQARYKC